MATLDDFHTRMEQMKSELTKRLPDIAIILTLSAKALSERNIKDKGFGAMYSQNKYPAFFLHGKELNGKGLKFLQDRGVDATGKQGKGKKKRRKRGETGDPGVYDTLTNWGEFRAAQGLQVAHVDVSYSNKMWANMAPLEPVVTGNKVIAPLGATNREAQDKMNYNRDRYGDFIGKSLSKNDMLILRETVNREILNVLQQFKP